MKVISSRTNQHTHTTSMKSWASIVKTPVVAVVPVSTAPARQQQQQQQQQGDIFVLLPPKIQTKKSLLTFLMKTSPVSIKTGVKMVKFLP